MVEEGKIKTSKLVVAATAIGGVVGGIIGYMLKPTSVVFMTSWVTPTGVAAVYLVKDGVKHLIDPNVWNPFQNLYPNMSQGMANDGVLIVDAAKLNSIKDGSVISSWKQFFQVLAQ